MMLFLQKRLFSHQGKAHYGLEAGLRRRAPEKKTHPGARSLSLGTGHEESPRKEDSKNENKSGG
jgi:hypothetical protein